MLWFTRGNWRLEEGRCNIERIVCDLEDGCTVAVAGIHHQTLQAERGIRNCGQGSGLYKERLSNAELILNAPDLYRYARRLKGLLDALAVEAFARDGNDSTRLDNIAASLKKIVNEYPLFQISDYLFDLDSDGNMDKKALTVPLAYHRGLDRIDQSDNNEDNK